VQVLTNSLGGCITAALASGLVLLPRSVITSGHHRLPPHAFTAAALGAFLVGGRMRRLQLQLRLPLGAALAGRRPARG
jgi:hypothetical protein